MYSKQTYVFKEHIMQANMNVIMLCAFINDDQQQLLTLLTLYGLGAGEPLLRSGLRPLPGSRLSTVCTTATYPYRCTAAVRGEIWASGAATFITRRYSFSTSKWPFYSSSSYDI